MPKLWMLWNARSGSAERIDEPIRERAVELGCELHACASAEGVIQAVQSACASQVDRLIVAGGDGTVSLVVNQLAPTFSQVEIGIVPIGTGNDLARSLGIPEDDPDRALEVALHGEVKRLDVVQVTGDETSYFVNAACAGFGGEVAMDLQREDKQRWGAFAYWMSAVSKLVNLRATEIHIELDSRKFDRQVFGITVANGRYVGGGFPIAAEAYLDDGLVDVIVIPVLPTLDLLSAGVNLAIDRWYRPEQVELFRARRVRILATPELNYSVDGEPLRQIEARFEVLPRVLACVVPERPEALLG